MRNLRYPSFSLDTLGSDPTPKSPPTPSTVVSLFSGCGGMDLGFMGGFYFGKNFYEKLPFRIIWANDLNKHACRTYQMNFSHPIHTGALSEVLATLPQRADIVMGGFPCQDVSVNGSRKGAGGKRTILYKEMISIISRLRPQAFIAENVKGLAMSHSAAFFRACWQIFAPFLVTL